MFGIPYDKKNTKKHYLYFDFHKRTAGISVFEKTWSIITFILGSVALFFVIALSYPTLGKVVNPLISQLSLTSLTKPRASNYEVFGFAPYWTINKLDSVDYTTLTTLAYFGVPIKAEGGLDRNDYGYEIFRGDKASDL